MSFIFNGSEQEEGSSDQDDEPYLHPSLASSFTKIEAVCILHSSIKLIRTFLKPLIPLNGNLPRIHPCFQAPSIPSIQYKPSADCAYSMLVNKITGKPPPSKAPAQHSETTIQSATGIGYYHHVPGQVHKHIYIYIYKIGIV